MKNEYAVIFDDWVISHFWSKIVNFYLKNIIFREKKRKIRDKKSISSDKLTQFYSKTRFLGKMNML